MSINWNEELKKVDEGTKPISQGDHDFRVMAASVATANTSGNKMIKLDVAVQGGPDNGKHAFVNIVFSFENPRAMKMTIRRLGSFGITPEFLSAQNPNLEQIAGMLIGRSVKGSVTHREWKGETQNDVDFIGNGVPVNPGALPSVPGVPNIPAPVVPQMPIPPAAAERSAEDPF